MSDVVLFGVNLLVLFEILGAFKRFGTDAASVVLERDVHADVGGDVVTLGADKVLALARAFPRHM